MDTDIFNIIIVVIVVLSVGGYFMYKQAKWKSSAFVGIVSDIVPKTAWRKKSGLVIGPDKMVKVVVEYKYYFKTDTGKILKLSISNPNPDSGDIATGIIIAVAGMPADQAEFIKLKIGDRIEKKAGEQFPVKI